MDYVFLSTVCAITGTMFMLFIYVYLYSVYKEASMGAWIVGWVIHFLRIALFESGMLDYKDSLLGSLVYQTLFIVCAAILVYGACLLIHKPLNTNWLYGAAMALLLSALSSLAGLSVFWKLTPPSLFAGIALFYIGNIFINNVKIKGIGNLVTGWAFILWGILTLIIPPFFSNTQSPEWITLLCGLARLLIASGILLVYFEKSTLDLLAKETYFRELADNSADIVYHYQTFPQEKVRYISPSVYLITGYSPEEFYVAPTLFQSIVHPDDRWTYETYINKSAWPKDVPLDYRLIHKDKRIIYIEQTFMPVYDKDGNSTGRQGIIRDVTARNHIKAVEDMYDRLYMVGKTAVSIAHQIRNPLSTIKDYLQMVAKKAVNQESYAVMLEEVERANSLISEYVLLSDEKKANLKHCTLNTIIKETLPMFNPCAAAAHIDIKTALADLPSLELDEDEIRCLLINLIRNGIEAMPYGGELLLTTQLISKHFGENEVILSIRDTGKGMPNNIVENFGTPFLTTKSTGIGLGLSICYRIATRNRAHIHIDTTETGTTFLIHFNIPKFSL